MTRGPRGEPVPAPVPTPGLLARAVRAAGLALVGFFYPRIAVSGPRPPAGAAILVANHPNGLLDPLVLELAAGRSLAFLAKSTLFGSPVGRRVMEAYSAIPVYRAKEADTARNEETFARCRALLAAGGGLALFPEGVSHDAPGLQPLKTGAARIALSSGVEGLAIVPAGLLYEEKEVFRSRVAVAFGAPIPVPPGSDDPEAVRALTARVAEELGELVLQADDRALWRGFVAVAAWSVPDGGRDLAAVDARARKLAEAYRRLVATDPARVEALVARTRRFVRVIDAIGIQDPLSLEAPVVSPVRAVLPLVLLAPPAAVGALLSWIPYRLVRPLALRLAGGHADVVGTYKALLGTVLIGAWWLAEAGAAAAFAGPEAGAAVLLLAPLAGHVALRWGERLELRREALRAGWLALRRRRIVEEVVERRRALVAEVEAALLDVGSKPDAPENPGAPS